MLKNCQERTSFGKFDGKAGLKMQREDKLKILEQALTICLPVSIFFLAAMCSSAVSVRRNHLGVFAIWIVTAMLLRYYIAEKNKGRTGKANFLFRWEWLYENREFSICLTIVFFSRLFMFVKIPRGDAAIYYNSLVNCCRNFDFSFQSFFESFRLAGHPTLGYAFFMSMGEFLTPGCLVGVLTVNLILTITAMYNLYQLLQGYWMQASKCRAAIYTMIVFSVPLFWGTFSYINPDYNIVIFFLFMVYAESRKRYVSMLFWLIILCMTKETAMLVIAGYFIFKCFYLFCQNEASFIGRIKNVLRDRSIWVAVLVCVCAVAYFVRQGSLFGWNSMTLSSLFGREDYNGLFDNKLEFRSDYAGNQILLVVLLNFAWIPSVVIAAFLIICLKKKKKLLQEEQAFNCSNVMGVIGGFLFVTIFLTLFITAPLNRYHIFTAVTWVLIACIVYDNVISHYIKITDKTELIYGLVILVCFTAQTFFSVDPFSNLLFERMDTGKMILLETGGTFEDKYGDPMVNNYQYTWIDEELDSMLAGVDYDEDMLVIDAGLQRTAVKISGEGGCNVGWNRAKQQRELNWYEKEETIPIINISTRKMLQHLSEDSADASHFYNKYIACRPRAVVYFIKYFNEPEDEWLNYLSQYYDIGKKRETDGYRGNIVYYVLTLKDNTLYME